MPPVGFEPIIPTGERQQTYALDRAATGTGVIYLRNYRVSIKSFPDYKHLLQENYVEYKHIFFQM